MRNKNIVQGHWNCKIDGNEYAINDWYSYGVELPSYHVCSFHLLLTSDTRKGASFTSSLILSQRHTRVQHHVHFHVFVIQSFHSAHAYNKSDRYSRSRDNPERNDPEKKKGTRSTSTAPRNEISCYLHPVTPSKY